MWLFSFMQIPHSVRATLDARPVLVDIDGYRWAERVAETVTFLEFSRSVLHVLLKVEWLAEIDGNVGTGRALSEPSSYGSSWSWVIHPL